MLRLICIWLLLGAILSAPALAQGSDIRVGISAQRRERNDPSKKSTRDDMLKKGEDCTYDITVTNLSLKDSPALTVKYIIFVEKERLGEKRDAERMVRVTGSEELPALKAQAKGTVATKGFELMRATLAPGYTYRNGGRANAKDTVKAVWIKVFKGEEMVGEYVNPSTIKGKEEWK